MDLVDAERISSMLALLLVASMVVDHHSRRAMGFMIFPKPPSSRAVQKFLDRTIQKNGVKPKYIITDKGKQFWCDGRSGSCPQ